MTRARNAALWLAPLAVLVLLYQDGLTAWFQADDFAWLAQTLTVHNFPDLLRALFQPEAQGTIRPLSERAFFMGFYALFGLNPLPFRLFDFAFQGANLLVIAAVARRLTGSPWAGFWAALLWCVNSSAGEVMTWTSGTNQILCAFFLLLAFYLLLLDIETGRPAYGYGQWAAFLLGLGALETMVVYPVLAAGYTWLCARKQFRRTLPLFAASAAFAIVHAWAAPVPKAGSYLPSFDWQLPVTLATYWKWTVSCVWRQSPWAPRWLVRIAIVLASTALLGFSWNRVRCRQWLPVFLLGWFVVVIAPVLPLRHHVTEYYPFVPAIGLALLAGWGIASARSTPWKVASLAVAALYISLAAPASQDFSAWMAARSDRVETMITGVARAHQLHPGKMILLDGMDNQLFWDGIVDRPFRLLGISDVYLTAGTEQRIKPRGDPLDLSDYILPAATARRALDEDEAVVYSVKGRRLRNVTMVYGAGLATHTQLPSRVIAGPDTMSYLFGPEWYAPDQGHRWMPGRATLRIHGPQAAGQKLYLDGICPDGPPAAVSVAADGLPLGRAPLPNGPFAVLFALPTALVGKPTVGLTVQVSRTVHPDNDRRTLGLAFGTFEIR